MKFTFAPLTEPLAAQILGWRYDAPYDVYNPTAGADGLTELLHGEYHAALDSLGQLAGFCCFGESARVPAGKLAGCYREQAVDIGIGLRPDLTGQGLGFSFLQAVLQYATSLSASARQRLSVLEFNRRAFKVYERAGFMVSDRFSVPFDSKTRTFLVMTRQAKTGSSEKTFASC